MHWLSMCMALALFSTYTWGQSQDLKDMHHDMDMDHDDMDMDHDMHMNMSGHGMMMYFHFGVDETVLFKGWKISNIAGMAGSMVGVFLMSFLYEGLKFYREHLFRQHNANLQSIAPLVKETSPRKLVLNTSHGLQTFLHMVQMISSYFLMLIFMTYNGWLCIALVLGSGCGYFTFGWKRALLVDISEHCH